MSCPKCGASCPNCGIHEDTIEALERQTESLRAELEHLRVERDLAIGASEGWEAAAHKALDEARRGVELLRDEQKLRAELERRLENASAERDAAKAALQLLSDETEKHAARTRN